MRVTVKLAGADDVIRALGQVSDQVTTAVVTRAMKRAAEPMAQAARALAPVETGELRANIGVSTKLNSRQKRKAGRKVKGESRVHVGVQYASGGQQAHLLEFGTAPRAARTRNKTPLKTPASRGRTAPRPFMRPAFAQASGSVTADIQGLILDEVHKAAARAARRAARVKK